MGNAGAHAAAGAGRGLPSGLVGTQFLRRQGLQHAELVTVRVSHDHPADVWALPDVSTARAEPFKPDLRRLVARPQIKVEAILARLPFRNPQEQQIRDDLIFRAALGWLQYDLVVTLKCPAPAQR